MRALPLIAASAALACGLERGGMSDLPCATAGDSVIAAAVREYVGTLIPRPQRFLVSVDSAVPDAARAALQSKGPTYLYSSDSALKKQVLDRLATVGDYPTLLLSFGGLQLLEGDHAVVRLGGRFVSGSLDNHPAPSKTMHFECDSARWRFSRAEEEQSS
jgi:hypothetical protein